LTQTQSTTDDHLRINQPIKTSRNGQRLSRCRRSVSSSFDSAAGIHEKSEADSVDARLAELRSVVQARVKLFNGKSLGDLHFLYLSRVEHWRTQLSRLPVLFLSVRGDSRNTPADLSDLELLTRVDPVTLTLEPLRQILQETCGIQGNLRPLKKGQLVALYRYILQGVDLSRQSISADIRWPPVGLSMSAADLCLF
jgi:hypothetical protein